MGPLHGVVGHSSFAPPPPTGTVSSCIGSIISIDFSVAAARSLVDHCPQALSISLGVQRGSRF
jgi:hypothetical protein